MPHSDPCHHGFYLLRTPLLTLDELEGFNARVDMRPGAFEEQLKCFFDTPLYREALYIASPAMYREFCKWIAGRDEDPRSAVKMTHTLYKYLVRMCTRCTPYGLFAGYNMGSITDTTSVSCDEMKIKRHARVDTYLVTEVMAAIQRNDQAKTFVRYFPNNTIYKVPDGYRYIEHITKNRQRSYFLSGFEMSEYVETVLDHARSGATRSALIAALEGGEISRDVAAEFIDEVIGSNILISELEPAVTGRGPLEQTTDFLNEHRIETAGGRLIHAVGDLLHNDPGIDALLQVEQMIRSVLPDDDSKDLLQVDMQLDLKSNQIAAPVIETVKEELMELMKVNVPYNNPALVAFKEQFIRRYEDEEMPLAQVLDPDIGIGYGLYNGENSIPQPLLEALPLIGEPQKEPGNGTYSSWIKGLLIRALVNRETEIVLQKEDLALFDEGNVRLPYSFYVMGALYASSGPALERGDFLFDLNVIAGPSAANLLARFCNGYPALEQAVQEVIQAEERCYPDALLAEIVHLPQSRTGNIIIRPGFRQCELPLITNSRVEAKNQVHIDDLMIAVRNDRIILRDKRLDKEVIPRLSSAHDFSRHNLIIYKFLGDLQYQGLRFFQKWNWGSYKDELFLPRVRYGKIIVHRATWNLGRKDFNSGNFDKDLARLKHAYNIPDEIEIVEGDNVLYVDTRSGTSLKLLKAHLAKYDAITIRESLKNMDNGFIDCEGKKRANELIIPFTRKPAGATQPVQQPAVRERVKRKFQTGSEWLTVKIYCGHKVAESLLVTSLLSLVRRLTGEAMIRKWFFVRYSDPDHHIRVRFYNDQEKGFWTTVLQQLHYCLDPLLEKGLIFKVQTDTYNRELERYGYELIDLAESIFHFDSEAIVKMLELMKANGKEDDRGLIAFLSVDYYLNDFEYSLPERMALMQQLFEAYRIEFGATHDTLQQLNRMYRNRARWLGRCLNEDDPPDPQQRCYAAILDVRSDGVRAVIRDRKELYKQPKGALLHGMLTSFLHMSLNRLFTVAPRRHELVVYHHMYMYYRSLFARNKKR